MITAAGIDHLMNRGWPAAHSTELDGWLVRRAAGVTLRANSVLPAGAPYDLGKALDYVETLYQAHGITPSFQISPAAQPTDLDDHLATRGYQLKNPTLVQCAEIADVLAALPSSAVEVNISSVADDAWMQFWWQNDGRGGPAEQAVARQILDRGPALYATIRSGDQIAAIGRLALVDDWSGLYCIATDPAFRRQGLAQAVIRALLQKATTQGVRHVYLSVLANNTPALTLYTRLGFTTLSRYHYRTLA
ncbi:GNAT family N-acetyltransferase [Kribbella albertanoniae]|uniref:GNAT family N-acetyltransferase n=1 Tax=Kribbella albertanoniae TaxID=1266829 RepID=A0A4R4PR58_9ACTN|nr:GNAT family N-acetyltransferase [Kribbella albertanoniae]TDC24619.1 GNAT family N-acetyltransferase [Kribbella albertanoniae]